MEYIIVGDTEKYKGCLVCLCGNDLEHAQDVLYRLTHEPTKHELDIIDGHINLRIEEEKQEDCWWNDGYN
jgi:hypothetical protein